MLKSSEGVGPGVDNGDVARQKNAFTQLFVEGCGIWSLQQLGYLSELLNCLWPKARAWGAAAVDIGFFMRSKIYPLFVRYVNLFLEQL